MNGQVTIYGLVDPRTNYLRYVGQTSTSLQQRFCSHLQEKSHTKKCRWIRGLEKVGCIPEIFEIETVAKEKANESECFWIAYLKSIGCPLTNMGDGGEGVIFTLEVRAKLSASHKGKKMPPRSPEHSQKMSLALKGKRRTQAQIMRISQGVRASLKKLKISRGDGWIHGPCPDERKEKIRQAHIRSGHKPSPPTPEQLNRLRRQMTGNKFSLGKKLSELHKEKISLALKGRRNSIEHIEKVRQALKGRFLSEECKRKKSFALMGKPWSESRRQSMLNTPPEIRSERARRGR